jgi:hypothetical protein
VKHILQCGIFAVAVGNANLSDATELVLWEKFDVALYHTDLLRDGPSIQITQHFTPLLFWWTSFTHPKTGGSTPTLSLSLSLSLFIYLPDSPST